MNIEAFKEQVKSQLASEELAFGEIIYNNCDCQILSQSPLAIEFLVNDFEKETPVEYALLIDQEGDDKINIIPESEGKRTGWDRYAYACLLQYEEELNLLDPKEKIDHKKYSREGMIKRVLTERRLKAEKASYRIEWANNIYGDHTVINEHGVRYKVLLRDWENETGYSNCPDAKFNKLGTTKHIMYAFRVLKNDQTLLKKLSNTYPFIEIYCDPLNENKITWHYPHAMHSSELLLITRYFKKKQFIEDTEIAAFLQFIDEASLQGRFCIRPEVIAKIERFFDQAMLQEVQRTAKPDYSSIKISLFPYQKEGVEFVLFKKAAIIADEMGLGKTIQAITSAVLKKQIFGFKKVLVVCPATLKSQWKKEIEKFTDEKALIVTGTPDERERQYLDDSHLFYIVNYETVLRDSQAINKAGIDYLILDEAQKIKNFETKTSSAVRKLSPKHILVITGTPIENKLIDIYSIMSVIDPYFFGPLWEFSYQHCLFDPEKPNKINGYYDLKSLNKQLSEVLIRREKRMVLDQLPNVQQIDIPIKLSSLQEDYHASYAQGISRIIRKKFLTPYDLQRLQLLLTNMRMVCDSTYLIDEETNESPKLEELKDILFNQLDLKNTDRKIIIFSEWIKVHKLIGRLLREHKIGFVELNGKVPVKSRGELIKKFEHNQECKVFLSTEAGGAGLNLQMADILINFELPWNPAKKNQRIGRIDRLGQKSTKLTIYNFISRNSIEQQIAAGLLIKQNLFEGVLNDNNSTNYVDFSSKGRSQFIQQLEEFISQPFGDEESTLFSEQENEPKEPKDISEMPDISQMEEVEDQKNDLQDNQDNDESKPENAPSKDTTAEVKATEIEQVMNNGMQFLAGLFKMSTGKDLSIENQSIQVDKETGEVVMKFKLPVVGP